MTPTSKPSIVALIPARAGSKRIPSKNTKLLAGKPLIQYTIEAAQKSGIFCDIIVSTDDQAALDITQRFASVKYSVRQPAHATDDAPDILWVEYVLSVYPEDTLPAAFAILRPTSPFRSAETIRRAWRQFQEQQPCDSLRAVEIVKQHPDKMWAISTGRTMMTPIRNWRDSDGTPFHSKPTQILPHYYIQNASLEIAWTRVVTETGTISGNRVVPFFTEGLEGFDINTPEDWERAEHLMATQPLEYL